MLLSGDPGVGKTMTAESGNMTTSVSCFSSSLIEAFTKLLRRCVRHSIW